MYRLQSGEYKGGFKWKFVAGFGGGKEVIIESSKSTFEMLRHTLGTLISGENTGGNVCRFYSVLVENVIQMIWIL